MYGTKSGVGFGLRSRLCTCYHFEGGSNVTDCVWPSTDKVFSIKEEFNVVTTGYCEKWEWLTCEVGSQEPTLIEEDYNINSSCNGEVEYLSLGGVE